MDIRNEFTNFNNTAFGNSYSRNLSLKNRRNLRLLSNAYDIYRASFDSNDTSLPFNKLEKIFYPKTIKYFKEFLRTQPFMPTTKFPSASIIKQNININPDGTTDINGVYTDSDGLVILDYDNIDDWEKIGFPKGSVSKGINITTDRLGLSPNDKIVKNINIGNIRFFVHALYPDKETIEGFEKCSKDSNAMLSYSYGCRSELIGFYFQQGIIVNIEPQNIVGCKNSYDKHSLQNGYKKTLKDYFSDCWIKKYNEGFSHREFMANLTKTSTGMENEDYIKFVKNYAKKPIQDIKPESFQVKIMKAFADLYAYIGGYVYDETYGIKPIPMGVFLDVKDYEKKENIIECIHEALEMCPIWNIYAGRSMKKGGNYLKKYALKKDIPLLVFNSQKKMSQ